MAVINFTPTTFTYLTWENAQAKVWDVDNWATHAPCDQFGTVEEDEVVFAEVTGKEPNVLSKDNFSLKDHVVRVSDKGIYEKVAVKDELLNAISFIRDYKENVAVVEYLSKEPQLNKESKVHFLEALKWPARGVISDLLWQQGVWTKDDLTEFVGNGGRHVGYTTFREFITGDYTYEKALFRLVAESNTSDRAMVEYVDIAIDVDDVYDRGMTVVTDRNAGVLVTFARAFSIEPEILVSMRSGTSDELLRPVVSNVTTTSFKVFIYDTNNELATGQFTWTASGY